MAKTPKFSTGLRHAMLEPSAADVALDVFDGGTMEIYGGSRPAAADDAPTGTLLVSITLPTPAFAASSSGARARAGVWSGTAGAGAAGGVVATWFRVKTAGDGGGASATDKRIDGEVHATDGDLVLANTTITEGDVIAVDALPVSIAG